MANLIVCCDGTWNTPDQEDNGTPSPTNVVRLHSAVAPKDGSGAAQHAYYRTGVGTTGGLRERLSGGAMGKGISNDVKSAYKWLCDVYRPGDRIFAFGFSRGAFTVRSLAGLMGACDLMDFRDPALGPEEKWARVNAAYDHYRTAPDKRGAFVPGGAAHEGTKMAFLGVWDTVGALGIPDELFINILDRASRFRFHDTELGASVACARHAVAIDERRQTFAPTLWDNAGAHQDAQEVWFTGVHGDVGGSYADRGLGDLTLEWIMQEARAKGLAFREGALTQLRPDFRGVQHNSLKGFYNRLRSRPRGAPNIASSPNVHSSARARHRNPPLIQQGYWPTRLLEPGQPQTVPVYARERWNATGLFLEKGQTYQLRAQGQWLDGAVKCGPDGPEPGFHWQQIFHALSAPSNLVQRLYRRRPGKEEKPVYGALRAQDARVFTLIGVIANGGGVGNDDQKLSPHQRFAIGREARVTPNQSGYLYCYANDVWRFYFNNKGSVSLTVTLDPPGASV